MVIVVASKTVIRSILHSQTETFCTNINGKHKWLEKIIVDGNDLTSTHRLLPYNYSSNSQRSNYRNKLIKLSKLNLPTQLGLRDP